MYSLILEWVHLTARALHILAMLKLQKTQPALLLRYNL